MNPEMSFLSADFKRLYCDAAVFDSISVLHPISFRRVLPFQYQEEGVDDRRLLEAEEAHLLEQNDDTRRAVVDEYLRCGLLQETEARDLAGVIDFYDTDFFDLMGLVYANVGRFRCALRWCRELIHALEVRNLNLCSDTESAYATVGYCLYSLGLFEEAILWSKACLGPRQTADAVCRALIGYEAELAGGAIRSIERAGPRTRYTVSSSDPERAIQTTPRLKAAMKAFDPFHEVYLDWVSHESLTPTIQPYGYPFQAEFDSGTLVRHKMNLIFATCALADALMERGYRLEAKRLLAEAAMVEPAAGMVRERLEQLS
jgi:tetratricopeptide (TPR) repeat protein